jgi:hypothetical protein
MTVQRMDPSDSRTRPPQPPGGRGPTPWYSPLSPTGGWPVLLPAVARQRRRRVWPWLLGVVVILAAGVSGWVFWLAPMARAASSANAVPIGASYTYPSGLVVTVSDIASYSSTNPDVIAAGDTAYRGIVTLMNGTANPVDTALMTIDVATGQHSDDRIFENAPPPTQDIAPGQQLKVPFAFTVVKQASGPLKVTVTAVLNQPAVFTDAA